MDDVLAWRQEVKEASKAWGVHLASCSHCSTEGYRLSVRGRALATLLLNTRGRPSLALAGRRSEVVA
jgi:hypothetical protein